MEIGRVVLRNEYIVTESEGGWTVTSCDGKGRRFSQTVPLRIVSQAEATLRGEEWTVDRATDRLRSVAERDDWPFTYGHKLRYFVQTILVVLVALGRADPERNGRAFHYMVHEAD